MIEQTIKQKKQLNHQLIHSLQLLPLNIIELQNHIHQISENNPFIEIRERHSKKDFTFFQEVRQPENSLLNDLHLQTIQLSFPYQTIIQFFILNLDDNGLLNEETFLTLKEMGYSTEDVERSLSIFQTFEPIGTGAKTLQESLYLQAKAYHSSDTLLLSILSDEFDLFLQQKNDLLCKQLGCNLEELNNCKKKLQQLEFYPLRNLYQTEEQLIMPDVIVEVKAGTFHIRLAQEELFQLVIQTNQIQELKKKDKELNKYLKEKEEEISLLLSSLDLRKQNIIKVMEYLIYKHSSFFKNETPTLNRCTKREIAQQLQIHESTVGRIVKGKYVATPQGLKEIEEFTNNRGKNHFSDTYIKQQLVLLINEENKWNPVTDEQLTELLILKGINISRRTVSKYRMELKIPNKNLRKNKGF